MTENEDRFGVSAIGELNGRRRARPEPKKNFALLMIGPFVLIALLYVHIIW